MANIDYRAGISGNSGDNEQEIESNYELKSESLASANGRNSNAAGHERVENALEGEWSANGGRNLCSYVRRHLDPGKVAQRCECNRQWRVQMSAGDVASW